MTAPTIPQPGEEEVTQAEYPLQARLWRRDSTEEWVLEISGAINDCSFTCRHTEPLSTAPEDAVGLPTLYDSQDSRSGRVEALEEAMVEAAIPLEALKLSGTLASLSPEMQTGVDHALARIAAALALSSLDGEGL